MVIGKPLFKANNELGTLSNIIEKIGYPNEDNWPGVSQLKNYLPFGGGDFKLGQILEDEGLSKEGINLMIRMLMIDPKKGLVVNNCLKMSILKKICPLLKR